MNKNPSIGYLVPEFPTQTHAFFWREIQALEELHESVELYSTKRPDPRACRHAFAKEARERTTYLFPPKVIKALAFLLGHPMRAMKALHYIAKLNESSFSEKLRILGVLLCAANLVQDMTRKGVKHIHIHSCANSAHLGSLANQLSGIPYSLSLHGDLLVYGKDHHSKMEEAAFVATVTPPLQDEVVKHIALPVSRVPVIRMGVDVEHFHPIEKAARGDKEFRIVTVARLIPQKGHLDALEAVRMLKNHGVKVKYNIIGSGSFRPELEKQVSKLHLQDQVNFTGSLSEDEIILYLQTSDVFLLPSYGLGEAAPVSVMEAMACQLPVVCSRIGGTPDLVHHGINGFLTPQQDSKTLFFHLFFYANNPETRKIHAEYARKHAVEQFNHRLMARHLRSFINQGGPDSRFLHVGHFAQAVHA